MSPGASKTDPFVIAFVANPLDVALNSLQQASYSLAPILRDRAAYLDCVRFCMKCLFALTEGLMYDGGLDAQMRVVSIFDPTKANFAANALGL